MTIANALAPSASTPRSPLLHVVREESNPLRDLLRLLDSSDADADAGGTVDMAISVRRLHEGDTLYGEGARADAFYFVRAGTFKTVNTGEDGYEQVLGFTGRGEALGFDAIGMGRYGNEAIALEESSVYVVPLRTYFARGPRSRALDEAVFRAISHALLRRSELANVMAAVAAEVRLARFLTHLSQQMQSRGQSPRRFHLRMSRRDIASYLGVAHETISRSFGTLVAWGLVTVDNREVEIMDLEMLKTLAGGTRRTVDEHAHFGAGPCGAGSRPKAAARRSQASSVGAIH